MVRSIQEQFAKRCRETSVPGKLVRKTGNVNRTICDRSRWAASVAVNLAYPPLTPLAHLCYNAFTTQ
jgi:hypothetical protein